MRILEFGGVSPDALKIQQKMSDRAALRLECVLRAPSVVGDQGVLLIRERRQADR